MIRSGGATRCLHFTPAPTKHITADFASCRSGGHKALPYERTVRQCCRGRGLSPGPQLAVWDLIFLMRCQGKPGATVRAPKPGDAPRKPATSPRETFSTKVTTRLALSPSGTSHFRHNFSKALCGDRLSPCSSALFSPPAALLMKSSSSRWQEEISSGIPGASIRV